MSSHKEDDAKTSALFEYCHEHNVHFHKHVIPRRVPGRGLGMYAKAHIARGERLANVPLTSLFTLDNIPQSFAAMKLRSKIPTHALLAAFFAFGPENALASLEPWIATWPRYSEFAQGMPLLWPETDGSTIRKTSQATLLPPPLTGSYMSSGAGKNLRNNGSTTLISSLRAKIAAHIASLEPILDAETYRELSIPYSTTYYIYMHAWLCVNTRCFSYSPYGKKRPKDPNEAMALCPGMDLFNHSAEAGVETKHDRSSYHAVATRDHQPGEEIFFNYGQHENDVLWAEYGFLPDNNSEDAIRVDTIVLERVTEDQKKVLKDNGYLGQYWLNASGVCYRSQVVAWMFLLDLRKWHAMLAGKYDPDRENEGRQGQVRSSSDRMTEAHLSLCAKWALKVVEDCDAALSTLNGMSSQTILELLGDREDHLRTQDLAFDRADQDHAHYHNYRQAQAMGRLAMCSKRWTQIREMAHSARDRITAS
ncbi:Ribosomal lysine N-methyltransferase set11 [Cyphellophora attinorum]|uniref:Ribosomal lysine N-methyltransferase set11 n=1 Tax=Cyphellophora attinorum TaxID=1664694 RepID=A0A0N1H910_9EURO|nr:Ribosomal lysine N-methyltransferase set11 [Phialophora attinorum]KPI43726.1 Ribosomal lysine N-methyltransferase set11 [Phialophora attinorum]